MQVNADPGEHYLQVLGSADIQAGDVLDPLIDLIHNRMLKRSEPGAGRKTGQINESKEADNAHTQEALSPLLWVHMFILTAQKPPAGYELDDDQFLFISITRMMIGQVTS